jgi:hypothetical protein
MQEEKKVSIISEAFDLLSSIPYLKKILKLGLVISTTWLAFAYSLAEWESTSHLLKSVLFAVVGNLIFAQILRLWDRRDLERQAEEQQ